jgi:hypothetical protein
VAIAGWLLIGIALLLLVAVLNNSWRPLFDQFRGIRKDNVTVISPRLADIKDRPPAEPPPEQVKPPADIVQPGAPPPSVAA